MTERERRIIDAVWARDKERRERPDVKYRKTMRRLGAYLVALAAATVAAAVYLSARMG